MRYRTATQPPAPPFDDLDDVAVAAARYRTRCPECGVLLQVGLVIFLLDSGWGCYACARRQQRRRRVEASIAELREDIDLWTHRPDRCDQPARKLAPPQAS